MFNRRNNIYRKVDLHRGNKLGIKLKEDEFRSEKIEINQIIN